MIATAELFDTLQREHTLYVDPTLVTDFLPAYEWMRAQMAERIPGYQGHYPWWAWRQASEHRDKPDLRARARYSRYFAPGTPSVRLELEISDAEVLVSDFDEWHSVLNHSPLAYSEEEWDHLEHLPEPQRTRAYKRTWPRMFAVQDPPSPL